MKPVRRYSYGGRELTLAELARTKEALAGKLTPNAIDNRIKNGWSIEEAVRTHKGHPNPRAAAAGLKRLGDVASPKERSRSAPGAKPERAKREAPAPDVAEDLRKTLAFAPLELLTRLGWSVEDLGAHPRGRLLLVAEAP